MKPLISILIPAYNCAAWIGETIDSIFTNIETCSALHKVEIIIADDGSTDDTADVVGAYCVRSNEKTDNEYPTPLRNAVNYFRKKHSGISATRNYCLAKAQGDYIAWCDADDFWEKGKLKAQMEYFEKHPDCEIVFTKFKNFLENENLGEIDLVKREIESETIKKSHFTTSLGKRFLYKTYGLFDENLTACEDVDMIYRFIVFGVKRHCIEQTYYMRRFHGNNSVLALKYDTQVFNGKKVLQILKNKIRV